MDSAHLIERFKLRAGSVFWFTNGEIELISNDFKRIITSYLYLIDELSLSHPI